MMELKLIHVSKMSPKNVPNGETTGPYKEVHI